MFRREAALRLDVSRAQYDGLRSWLVRVGDTREHAAFLFAEGGRGGSLRVVDVRLLEGSDFKSQSKGYLELREASLQDMIVRAHRTETTLVEAHSHPFALGQEVGFSPLDREGLADVAPHVVWRLPGRPYVALVFGSQAFDGLYWSEGEAEPSGFVDLRVDGVTVRATRQSWWAWGASDGPLR